MFFKANKSLASFFSFSAKLPEIAFKPAPYTGIAY